MQLTIVIPTYNEVENIRLLVPVLMDLPCPGLKVLVVDDDSPDGTGPAADELTARYAGRVSVLHRKGKLGFGSAYIEGFRRAIQDGAEAIGQMDADFSHPPEKIVEMYAALNATDIVLGSRYVPDGQVDEIWPLWRKALSAFGNQYARWILRIPVSDVTGGFRLWRRETLANMPLERVRANGYAFQIEMLYIAYRLGYAMHEIPIYFAERDLGQSKMSFKIQVEAAFRVWQIRFSYQDLRPKNG